jgi:RNase H-like domain found in reverse transcriptase
VKPLTDLLKKDVSFFWSSACQNAFDLLKQKLHSAPVLAIHNPDEPFELVCDACKSGTGAVLLQGGKPVAFEGRKFTPREMSRSFWLSCML